MRKGGSARGTSARRGAGTTRGARRLYPTPLTAHVSIPVTAICTAPLVCGARATASPSSSARPAPARPVQVRTGGAVAGGLVARRRRWLSGAGRLAVVLDETGLLKDPADQPSAGDPDVLVHPARRRHLHP